MVGQKPADALMVGSSCATHKTDLHLSADQAERVADLFKTLGHPVRAQIVMMLSRGGGDVCVCDIERHFDVSQPTISHHLKKLRDAGVVYGVQHGLWVHYSLVPGVLETLRQFLNGLD
ncbi:MAG: helix-turn-helix transcriptional regulator [Chloroflexi bacterium]|nr:helix-turn-helix transcriptional regulator [Chloroflexota bacterium]